MNFAGGLRWAASSALCLALTAAGCAHGPETRVFDNPFAPNAASEERAEIEYSRRSLTNPGRTHLAYARLQESWGNLDEARQSYRFVLGEDPRSVDAILGLARIDQLAGRTQEAEKGFQKALKINPRDPVVLAAAGEFYAAQKNWREAVRYLHEATQSAPHDTNYQFQLAVALARSGNIDHARPHFAWAVGDAEAHYNIGHILFEQGRFDEAERELSRAVAIKPELQQAQHLLDELAHERAARQLYAGRPS